MLLNPSQSFLERQATELHHEHILEVVESQVLTLEDADKDAVELNLRREIVTGPAPRNAEELHDCIYALTGMTIPYTVCDPDDPLLVSPFEYLWRIWTGEWEKTLAWASRESGKTWIATFAHYLLGNFNPKHEGLHAGGVTRQAEIASTTLQQFSRDKAMSVAFRGEPGARKADFQNGASFRIAPGKYKSIDGQHPNTLSCDEVKHWGIKDLQQTWGIPSNKHELPKRLMFLSTNQDAGGGFNFLLDEAPERNVRIAKWTVMETMQPCQSCKAIDEVPFPAAGDEGDEQRSEACLLWKFCRGKKGLLSTGWKKREEIEEFVRSLGGPDTEEARTQAFCEKPSTRGLVLHNFEHAPLKDGGNWTNTTYDYEGILPFLVSIDPAEANKCAIGFWHWYQNRLLMFDELIIEQCASAMDAKEAFFEYCQEKKYRDPDVMVFDPRKTDAIRDFKRGTPEGEGINRRYKAVAAPIDGVSGGAEVEIGLRETREMICFGIQKLRRLFINPDACPKTIQAIKNWMYRIEVSGDIKGTARPTEIWKDEGDMIRYMVRYAKVKLMRQSKGLQELDLG